MIFSINSTPDEFTNKQTEIKMKSVITIVLKNWKISIGIGRYMSEKYNMADNRQKMRNLSEKNWNKIPAHSSFRQNSSQRTTIYFSVKNYQRTTNFASNMYYDRDAKSS